MSKRSVAHADNALSANSDLLSLYKREYNRLKTIINSGLGPNFMRAGLEESETWVAIREKEIVDNCRCNAGHIENMKFDDEDEE